MEKAFLDESTKKRNKPTKQYRHKVGDILESVSFGKLKILKQIRMPHNKSTQKGYKYECLICGNKEDITEVGLDKNYGCNVCSIPSHKTLRGVNDLWTTHPEIAKMLKYPEIGYTISHGSNSYQIFICPNCGCEKSFLLNNLIKRNFSCPKCGDKVSYPEKFMFSILEQLDLDFTTQLSKSTFKWCNTYKYDFYIPSLNCIIETHGLQHYEESGRGRSLIEENWNDNFKRVLAITNKIDINNYIIIDCRLSDLDFIKNSILNNKKITNLFDLSNINWMKCEEYAYSSMVKKACDLWNSGVDTVVKLSDAMKLGKNSIRKYLKQGTLLDWCKYDVKEEKSKNRECIKRKVICINNNKIYNSITEANSITGITSIVSCCNPNVKECLSAGRDDTGKKLIWMYYDDYLKSNRNEIENKLNIIDKKVICINNNEIFNSFREANQFCGIKVNSGRISQCCLGKSKYAGKDLKTGFPYVWQYYKDYLKYPKSIDGIRKKVICLNNNKIFNSTIEAGNLMNLNPNGIYLCCNPNDKYNHTEGKDSITGEKFIWMYYEDYLMKSKKDIKDLIKIVQDKKVICLTTSQIFNSINQVLKLKIYNCTQVGIHQCCIHKYNTCGELEDGTLLQWMYYEEYLTSSKEEINNILTHTKKYICITTGEIFNTKKDAGEYYNMKSYVTISECCSNKKDYCGRHPKNKEKLKWMYYKDYLNATEEEICNKLTPIKRYICTTTGKIFNTIKEAGIYYNITSYGGISACCTNRKKSCGNDPETGKRLNWMYY